MPAVTKAPGSSVRVHDSCTNIGNVPIHLGLAPVMRGPVNYGFSVTDYGTLSPGDSVTVDIMFTIPEEAPAGKYRCYLAVVDLDTGETLEEVDTGWDINVQAIKAVEITGIVVE